jgi:hypothetical protein
VIKQADFIESIADSLQYISYYHPKDFVDAMTKAYEREESAAAKEAYLSGKTYSPSSKVDFTLSGKIIQPPKVKVGSDRQNSYIFQLTLTQVGSGLAVWEDEKTITKQYKKSSIGW